MFNDNFTRFRDFGHVHNSYYQKVNELASLKNSFINTEQDINIVFSSAVEDDFVIYKDRQKIGSSDINNATKIYFDTHFTTINGESIFLKFEPNNNKGLQPWFCVGIIHGKEIKFDIATDPGELLMTWAYLNDWRQTVQKLRDMALPEKWYYGSEDNNNDILWNYLRFTFSKLWRESKVMETNNYAAFNTGLVDERFEYIYAMFVPNPSGQSEWRFKGFCVEAEEELGKDLIRFFNPLPRPATYFRSINDMVYMIDSDRSLRDQAPRPDYRHIIIENTQRLPMDFLIKQCYDYPDIMTLIDDVQKKQIRDERLSIWSNISKAIDINKEVFKRIKDRISEAIDLAVKRVAWNYKTAIPMYYPKGGKMTLLLPLSLNKESVVDVALVVESTGSGNYLGHTIIELDWAYNNSRLVCKPLSDWLTPELIQINNQLS